MTSFRFHARSPVGFASIGDDVDDIFDVGFALIGEDVDEIFDIDFALVGEDADEIFGMIKVGEENAASSSWLNRKMSKL